MTKEEILRNYRVGEIREATRRVIGRFGFEGATLDRVADEARIAKGTVYLYFKNKDDLLHATIVEGLRALTEHIRHEDDAAAPPLDRIRALVRTMLRLHNSHQDFLKALILDSRLLSDEPGDRKELELRKVYLKFLDHLASVMKAAAEKGAIRSVDPQIAAFMLCEMMNGRLRRRSMGLTTANASPKADADVMLDLFLYGVRGLPPEKIAR